MAIRLAQQWSAGPGIIVPDHSAIEVTLFHDVFCAWSYIADQRLNLLREELGAEVRFSYKPFPLRSEPIAPDKKQRQALARNFRRAAREPEGGGMVADLWTNTGDLPSSSLPALIALEAAKRESPEMERELLYAMREAVFLRGLNVARLDVQLELAEQIGLDISAFLARLEHPSAALAVKEAGVDAAALNIKGSPALVIGDEWMLQGCRDVEEYREMIEKYLTERTVIPLHAVH